MASEAPFPTSVELVLRSHAPLVDTRQAYSLTIEAAVAAMAPATKAAHLSDLKCCLGWCEPQQPRINAIPAATEALVHYLRWLAKGSEARPVVKPYHQAHGRGVKIIGATAHYVTADLDEGPIIEQDVRRVNHSVTADEMVAIGREVEASVLSRAVRAANLKSDAP